jgi:hypothetical protein
MAALANVAVMHEAMANRAAEREKSPEEGSASSLTNLPSLVQLKPGSICRPPKSAAPSISLPAPGGAAS